MEKWNDCINGQLFSDLKETRKMKVMCVGGWGQTMEKRGRGQGGKWMRQEETRACKEVGGWNRVEGKGRRKGDSR